MYMLCVLTHRVCVSGVCVCGMCTHGWVYMWCVHMSVCVHVVCACVWVCVCIRGTVNTVGFLKGLITKSHL